jgi:hypothetical protein
MPLSHITYIMCDSIAHQFLIVKGLGTAYNSDQDPLFAVGVCDQLATESLALSIEGDQHDSL